MNFFDTYINTLQNHLQLTSSINSELLQICTHLNSIQVNKKKVIIIGNGGSAAIASHVATDLTKTLSIPTMTLSDPSLLTCLSNDYGYENAFSKGVLSYGQKGDCLIAISSSGESKNILNACDAAKQSAFSSIITLSGFQSTNPLRGKGDINLWVDSKHYNMVENTHQIWLLSCIDYLINQGKDC